MTIYLSSFFALTLGLAYFWLTGFLIRQWEKRTAWTIPATFKPETKVSVLIPARNEAQNILNSLETLLLQQFPFELLEILVVDDHSSDSTAALVREYEHPCLKLLQLSGSASGKKAALAFGIQHATGDLILTTDADCLLPPRWISSFVSYYQENNPVFITAPVVFQSRANALERFQALDMLGTMLITGAGIQSGTIHLSNGANLAYPKAIFEAVDGFTDIDQLASGDDMLLMHKIEAAYPGRIGFLKSPEAVVITPAARGWRAFIQQRLRWATKSGTYRDRRIIAVLGLVFLLCWSIILSPLLVFLWGWTGLWPFLLLFSLKATADYRLLSRAAGYFNRRELMRYFWPSQLLHIAYIALIGLLANLVREYEWKGRNLR